ncbi:patatin-like phospholipase family protein [Parerythrobacter aestuarii]|uniref:patatin-like phospholipase family protein n=1 Tax=Parerythrobacter aestuarii TaxID=3020909 RepID=UPI0024DEDFEF|nr:patatin-like phospholipase family protein [Parerythrobacter aestuarii]
MRTSILAMGLAALVLSGCGINQKAPLTTGPQMCGFITHSLSIPIPDPSAPDQLSPFAADIEASLSTFDAQQQANMPETGPVPEDTPLPEPGTPPEPAPEPVEPEPANMLFLSGGSEHGAYGAGILKGWGGDGQLPDFQVVTGISTGSILSSFAFVGKGDFAADGYTISSESQLLNVYSKPKNGKPDIGNYMDLIKKGAFANLDPLRSRIKGFLTKDYVADGTSHTTTVMAEIARRHAQGRRLYVGAVDIDSGIGTAFNMGDMATRYDTARLQGEPDKMEKWLDCYVSAIIASSSTPMAAPPVFIDNTMYVDGGARFGLFGDTVIRAVRVHSSRADEEHRAHAAPRVYAVLNGTMQLPPPACPKEDPSLCNGDPPAWPNNGQHKDWNILELALKSERVLVNQVYRFSAQSVEDEACNGGGCFNFLRIEPDISEFAIALPAPLNAGNEGELTCPQWTAVDIATDNPIQFHKRYMRCLIRYGESKVQEAGWGS